MIRIFKTKLLIADFAFRIASMQRCSTIERGSPRLCKNCLNADLEMYCIYTGNAKFDALLLEKNRTSDGGLLSCIGWGRGGWEFPSVMLLFRAFEVSLCKPLETHPHSNHTQEGTCHCSSPSRETRGLLNHNSFMPSSVEATMTQTK